MVPNKSFLVLETLCESIHFLYATMPASCKYKASCASACVHQMHVQPPPARATWARACVYIPSVSISFLCDFDWCVLLHGCEFFAHSIGWFKGKITGKSHTSWENLWKIDGFLSHPTQKAGLLELGATGL